MAPEPGHEHRAFGDLKLDPEPPQDRAWQSGFPKPRSLRAQKPLECLSAKVHGQLWGGL